MTDSLRLKAKIGINEFDGDGPAEVVKSLYESWKASVDKQTPTTQPATTTIPGAPTPPAQRSMPAYLQTPGMDGQPSLALQEGGWNIFDHDERRKLVSLKAHPQTDDRDADAALLVLYGFRRILSTDEVLVGRVKDAMEASGLRPDRIDKALGPSLRQGLVLKTGRGPGGKYRLSNTGQVRADILARRMFEQMG
jgi:hypothetical protein